MDEFKIITAAVGQNLIDLPNTFLNLNEEGCHMESLTTGKIKVQNVNHPEHVRYVDAAMYAAMRQAYLKVLPTSSPGITLAEFKSGYLVNSPNICIRMLPRRAGGLRPSSSIWKQSA